MHKVALISKMKTEQGKYYHIYNRGNNRNIVFFDDYDYAHFLNQFEKYVSTSCSIYAYCLMPNHFHFFLKITDKVCFDKGIRNFFISYAKSINFKYNRVGSLFQGRFKSQEIAADSYFTRVITYIHQNPLVAGMVDKLEDYEYSSYRAYLLGNPTILNKNEIIEWFNDLEGFVTAHIF